MTSETLVRELPRSLDLTGQTVVVLGGSSGIGLETARLAHACGAEVVVTARDAERLRAAADEVGAREAVAFDLTDLDRLERFFEELAGPFDHVLVTGPGPYYSTVAEMNFELARREVEHRLLTPLAVGRFAAPRMRPGGGLIFMGGTGLALQVSGWR